MITNHASNTFIVVLLDKKLVTGLLQNVTLMSMITLSSKVIEVMAVKGLLELYNLWKAQCGFHWNRQAVHSVPNICCNFIKVCG